MGSSRRTVILENSMDITCPPEVVFDYLTDTSNEFEWNPKTKRVQKLTDGPIGLRTRYEGAWVKGDSMLIRMAPSPFNTSLDMGRSPCSTRDIRRIQVATKLSGDLWTRGLAGNLDRDEYREHLLNHKREDLVLPFWKFLFRKA
jgi:hypothetical protein